MPIILGSDKTTVSIAMGQNEYWPIYGVDHLDATTFVQKLFPLQIFFVSLFLL